MFWKKKNDSQKRKKKRNLEELSREISSVGSKIRLLSNKSTITLRDSTWKSRSSVQSEISKVQLVIKELPDLEKEIIDIIDDIQKLPEETDWQTVLAGLVILTGVVGGVVSATSSTRVKSYRRKDGTRVRGHNRKDNAIAKASSSVAAGSVYLASNMDWSQLNKQEKENLSPKERALLQCHNSLKFLGHLKSNCRNSISNAQEYINNPIAYRKRYQRQQLIKIYSIAQYRTKT